MPATVALNNPPRVASVSTTAPAVVTPSCNQKSSKKQRAKLIVACHARSLVNICDSDGAAIDALFEQAGRCALPQAVLSACKLLATQSKPMPGRSTIYKYFDLLRNVRRGEADVLASNYKGKQRTEYGWESRALELYQCPTRPKIRHVQYQLEEEGFADVNYHRVRTFIKSLPDNIGKHSPKRIGKQEHRLTQHKYKLRSTADLKPGHVYQGDGHTLDVYLQHPTGNRPWRAELTVWIDVASRYIVGWWLSEAESANSTLFALSHAVLGHDHIPAYLHIDNGSGFINEMMSDEAHGFYARLGVSVMRSIPGQPTGKGQVERFFGTLSDQMCRRYDSFCGNDRAERELQQLLTEHKRGTVLLPTQEQWLADFKQWLMGYHNRPHRALDGATPAERWAQREHFAVQPKEVGIFMPRKLVHVRRQMVVLHKRHYGAPELAAYNNNSLIAEYSLHDDQHIRLLDGRGNWLCDAKLVSKMAYLPESRLEEAKEKRLAAQVARLEKHAAEKRLRSKALIDHTPALEQLERWDTDALDDSTNTDNNGIDQAPQDLLALSMQEDIDNQHFYENSGNKKAASVEAEPLLIDELYDD